MKIEGSIQLDALSGLDEDFLALARRELAQGLSDNADDMIFLAAEVSEGRVMVSVSGELFGEGFAAIEDLAVMLKSAICAIDADEAKPALIALRENLNELIREM